jgi:exodeoxyribonuclease VII large subunit
MPHSERISLYDICQRIQQALYENFAESTWVVAEIGDMKENRSGHCYLELVEKNDENGQPKAKARATIWAGNFRVLKPFFEAATGRRLSIGLKVLVLCEVNYHPVYGLSLNIKDIDPNFTIGDIEKKRQETIQMLIDEGVFDMNKQIDLPILPKRVAVISSPTAAGYEDFINHLNSNPYGYCIEHHLFEAIMQGEKAEESIVNALDIIHSEVEMWDIVSIIRGGGSLTDLSCFDGYTLASNIAQFPIPVITGIGHEKDTSIADMVSHTRLKTPTAAAEFIIGAFANAESLLLDIKDDFIESIQSTIANNKHLITKMQGKVAPLVLKNTNTRRIEIQRNWQLNNEICYKYLSQQQSSLSHQAQAIHSKLILLLNTQHQITNNYSNFVSKNAGRFIDKNMDKLSQLDKSIQSLDPKNVLKRGYSITLHNGKIVKSVEQIDKNQLIETIISDGRIASKVIQKIRNKTTC